MRKIMFYIWVVLNVIKSFFFLIGLKLTELKGDELKTRKYFEKVSMKIIRSVSRGLRLDYDIHGKENIPEEACLFVSNHQSYFDVLAIMVAAGKPMGFVAKEELKKLIYFRYWLAMGNCVFINRKNPREGLKAINKASENIKNGSSMVIFPEGTRSRSAEIGEFKKGSMKVATKAGAKIVPIAVKGTYKAYEKTEGYGKVKARVVFGEAIDTSLLAKEELSTIHEVIRERIVEMNK